MSSRRFVNLLLHDITGRQAPLSIHRINPANLFHPTGRPVPTPVSAEFATKVEVPLPPAEISFEWPFKQQGLDHCSMEFIAFGRDRDKILGTDSLGRASLYDFASSRCLTCTSLPNMPQSVRHPMSVAVGDNCLFVMSNNNPHFMALMDGLDPSTFSTKPNWYWQSLQRPPFASDSYDGNKISAYTTVGTSQIWVSAVGAGTFAFDPESGAWNKAGDWAMPFSGHAEYLPEHNLWFGFSSHKCMHICVSDLTAASTVRPPVPLKLWRDLVWPEDWKLTASHLLPLGSGRLCIARFFITSEETEDMWKPDIVNHYVVLAGWEVVSRQGRLRFVKHKSQRYCLGRDFADPL